MDETARLPCLATAPPQAATTRDAVVEMLLASLPGERACEHVSVEPELVTDARALLDLHQPHAIDQRPRLSAAAKAVITRD